MDQTFTKIYGLVWQELFPDIEPLPTDKFKELYTSDIVLPVGKTSGLSNTQVYLSEEYGYKKVLNPEDEAKKDEEGFWTRPKKEINSLSDVLNSLNDIAYFKGNRSVNSESVFESDDIYSSNLIYQSTHLYNCQKMIWCNNVKTSEYLLASKGSADSTFGAHILDSGGISNSFDIHWCGKSTNSYFCHDASDLQDCMFCFHTSSKQYCIANMQFTKEEYFKLKQKILTDYFAQLDQPNAFVTLRDIK